MLSQKFGQMRNSIAEADRLFVVLEAPINENNDIQEEANAQTCIVLKNVFFGYDEIQIIHDLSLEIKKGDKVAIIGKSGCGKSTLLNLISGICLAKQGSIFVSGQGIAKEIAYIGQDNIIFSGSILHNFHIMGCTDRKHGRRD